MMAQTPRTSAESNAENSEWLDPPLSDNDSSPCALSYYPVLCVHVVTHNVCSESSAKCLSKFEAKVFNADYKVVIVLYM